MKRIGFDNDKYLSMQSAHIRERIEQFEINSILNFWRKFFDHHPPPRPPPGRGTRHKNTDPPNFQNKKKSPPPPTPPDNRANNPPHTHHIRSGCYPSDRCI